MSPRDSFWFLAGVVVAVAIMVSVRSWLRERPKLGEAPVQRGTATDFAVPAFAVPVAAALALVGVAVGIYFLLGSPDSIASPQAATPAQASHDVRAGQQQSPTAGSLDDVTGKLAARLAAQGGSDNDWQLLAASYEYMGRTADAKAARAHMPFATPMPSATSMPPATSMPSATSMPFATLAAAANAMSSATPVKSGPAAPNEAGNAAVSGTVEVTSELARQAAADAILFIYAKQPNAPGPPLAVLRLRAEHWPVSFTLNDANAMIPGHNLSNANTVQIEARISKSGDALPHSGDLLGTVTGVNPHDGHPVRISIDRQIG